MRIAGSLPRLPQRLRVRGETRRRSATSLTVSRSGRFFRSTELFIIRRAHYRLCVDISNCMGECQ